MEGPVSWSRTVYIAAAARHECDCGLLHVVDDGLCCGDAALWVEEPKVIGGGIQSVTGSVRERGCGRTVCFILLRWMLPF